MGLLQNDFYHQEVWKRQNGPLSIHIPQHSGDISITSNYDILGGILLSMLSTPLTLISKTVFCLARERRVTFFFFIYLR